MNGPKSTRIWTAARRYVRMRIFCLTALASVCLPLSAERWPSG